MATPQETATAPVITLHKEKIFADWEMCLEKLHLYYKASKPEPLPKDHDIVFSIRLVTTLGMKPAGDIMSKRASTSGTGSGASSVTASRVSVTAVPAPAPAAASTTTAKRSSMQVKKEATLPRIEAIDIDPFKLPEEHLLVGPLLPSHKLIFNKFAIVKHDMIIATDSFASQFSPLDLADFEAMEHLSKVFEHDRMFYFFNCGIASGASILHKHVEALVYGPNDHVPAAHHIKKSKIDSHCQIDFPYAHAVHHLSGKMTPQALLDLSKELIEKAIRNAGRDGKTPLRVDREARIEPPEFTAYNLLITNEFMLVVPRSKAMDQNICVNSMDYSGILIGRSVKDVEFIKKEGAFAVLKACSFPKQK